MKPTLKLLIAAGVLSLLLAACSARPDPLKVRIATDATFPPFENFDTATRQYVGFDVELIRAIAARSGLEVEFVNVRLDPLLAGVAQCQYDAGISAIPISAELQQKMSFSDPYFTNSQVVVVKKGNPAIAGRDTLKGMAVGFQRGTPGEAEAAKIGGLQARGYDALDSAFQDLIAGLIDAVIADRPAALKYTGVRPNNLAIAGPGFAPESYGIAVCSQKPELLKRVNAGIAAVKSDGMLKQLADKWLSGAGN